jgi:Cu/Ag efflux protein CusF
MMQILNPLVLAAVILALSVPSVMAQVAPPPGPAAPGGSGPTELPAPKMPIPPEEKTIDGPVKKVDPATKTVQVGWFLGLMSTTLEVTEATRIAVSGTKASLTDLREGDRVKAAYEARDGKNIAKAIEVTPPEPTAGSGPATEAPAAPRPPQ